MQAKVNTMVCGLNNWHFCVFTPVSTDPWLLELFRICRIWINSQENLSGNSQNQVYTQETITERSCASAFESISHAFHHISPSTQFTGQRPSLPRCFGKRERPQEMMLVDWWDNGWFFRCSQANLDESGWNLIEAVSQKQKKHFNGIIGWIHEFLLLQGASVDQTLGWGEAEQGNQRNRIHPLHSLILCTYILWEGTTWRLDWISGTDHRIHQIFGCQVHFLNALVRSERAEAGLKNVVSRFLLLFKTHSRN